jgi:hypothetical protein
LLYSKLEAVDETKRSGHDSIIISNNSPTLAWYAEFLLEIHLKVLLRKTGARLNFKIALISLHIDPGLICRDQSLVLKFRLAPVFLGKKQV